jgi:hypothetical protein
MFAPEMVSLQQLEHVEETQYSTGIVFNVPRLINLDAQCWPIHLIVQALVIGQILTQGIVPHISN